MKPTRGTVWVMAGILAAVVAAAGTARAAGPGTISYQGTLLADDGTIPADGNYAMRLTLFDDPAVGTARWQETRQGSHAVALWQGTFAVELGELTPLDDLFVDYPALWLEVQVDLDGDGLETDEVYSPRVAVSAAAYAFSADVAAGLAGESFIAVQATGDAATNGANLLAAYTRAKARTPYGAGLSPTNRVVVLVPPGRYSLGTQSLNLDTNYVDVVGLTSIRDDQYIYGASAGRGTGVIQQSATNVRLANLTVECVRSSGGYDLSSHDPAAYFPQSNRAQTTVLNCTFLADEANAWSMRLGVEYSGTFERCMGGRYAFGGSNGEASGTFTDCVGGTYSFGGLVGTASGTFTRCTGGSRSFGGWQGYASGLFVDCTGGSGAFGGDGGYTMDCAFVNCRQTGSWNASLHGTMDNCTWGGTIVCGPDARIYDSTIDGDVNLAHTAAGIRGSHVTGEILNVAGASFNDHNTDANGPTPIVIGKDSIAASGTLGFDWQDDEVSDSITALTAQTATYALNAGVANEATTASHALVAADADHAVDADTLGGLDPSAYGLAAFDAVVAPSGGDYDSIRLALLAGHRRIYVRNGTYSDGVITIYNDGTSIIGESREGVIITRAIYAGLSSYYDTGTISMTTDEASSRTVTGVGTSWLGTVSAGDRIRIAGELYPIESVDTNVQLTLGAPYRGNALTGEDYLVMDMREDVRLENLTVEGSYIELDQTLHGVVRNCALRNTPYSHALQMTRSAHCRIEGCRFKWCWYAIRLEETVHSVIEGNFVTDSTYGGILIYAGADYNVVQGNSCTNCGSNMIYLSGARYNTISGNTVRNGRGSGIYLRESEDNTIVGNVATDCDNSGIEIYDDCLRNTVSANSVRANDTNGIRIVTNSHWNVVVGNVTSDNNSYGLYVSATCQENMVGMNVMVNDTGLDGGTNTQQTGTNYPPF